MNIEFYRDIYKKSEASFMPDAVLDINLLCDEVERLQKIERAAINFCKVKGRHHSEIAMKKLMELCNE